MRGFMGFGAYSGGYCLGLAVFALCLLVETAGRGMMPISKLY